LLRATGSGPGASAPPPAALPRLRRGARLPRGGSAGDLRRGDPDEQRRAAGGAARGALRRARRPAGRRRLPRGRLAARAPHPALAAASSPSAGGDLATVGAADRSVLVGRAGAGATERGERRVGVGPRPAQGVAEDVARLRPRDAVAVVENEEGHAAGAEGLGL